MTTPRDWVDGDYLLTCVKCGERFSGYKSDRLCLVCQPDVGPPTMAEWKSFAEATLQGWQRDAARLDWLEAQGDGSPWIARQSTSGHGYRLHNSTQEGGSETARQALDKAMETDKR